MVWEGRSREAPLEKLSRLRYGPAGDSATRLRLKASGMAERFLSARPHGPNPPFPLINSHPFGSARSRPGREAAIALRPCG